MKIIFILVLLVSLFSVNAAYAGFHTGPLVPCGTDSNPEACNLCHLWNLGSNLINFISFNLAIPVAAALFIVAGVLFLISGGIESRVTLAKSIFTSTVIGLVIIFVSWMLVDTLLKTIADESGILGMQIVYFWNVFPYCN